MCIVCDNPTYTWEDIVNLQPKGGYRGIMCPEHEDAFLIQLSQVVVEK